MANVIERQLGRVRTRVRLLTATYGSGHALVAVSVAALGVVGLDYLLNLPAVPRVVLLAAAASAVAGVIVSDLVRPLLARLTLSDMAGRVEEAFPQFDDRLRSAVAFGDGAGVDSPAMRARVTEEATKLAASLKLTKAIPGRPAGRSIGYGAAAAALVALLAVAMPGEYRSAAWGRVSHPFAGVAWPKRTAIEIVGALPVRIPAGERVPVKVRLTKGDRPSARTTVYYQYDNGAVRSELMSRGADGTYAASLDAKADADAQVGLKVWVRAGDDEKHLDGVAVVPRLAVRKVTAHVIPPEYARAKASDNAWDLTQGGATIVEGSQVKLEIEFNKALAGDPELMKVGQVDAVPLRRKLAGAKADIGLAPAKTVRFTIAAKDEDGFPTSSLTEYEIAVRPDQPPGIQIEEPRRNEDRTPNAVVPLQGIAEDDFAVKAVTLHVRRVSDSKVWDVPLVAGFEAGKDVSWAEANSSPDRVRMKLAWLWELGKLQGADLKPGDILEYYLLAQDNYVGPQGQSHEPASSSRLRITIVSQEEMANRFVQELRGIGEQIDGVKNRQHQTKVETGEFADQTKGKPLDEPSRGQARRLGDQEATIAGQTKGIAGKVDDIMARMAENRLESRELPATAKDVRDTLNRAAEGPMRDATSDVAQGKDAAPAERDPKMSDAVDQERKAESLLGDAQKNLERLGSLRATMAAIGKILEAQRQVTSETRELGKNNVGKTPDQISPEDRKKLDDLTKRQADLSKETDKLLESMDKQSGEMAKSDPQSAEAMKQASDTGKQQGVSAAQSKASSEVEQNKQQDAQDDQRRAEIGLQTMMEQLRSADKAKLEELSRKLADLQEQIAILIRRQAGHNLDNAGLRNAVGKIDGETLAHLLQASEREKDKATQGDQAALSGGQEQTERNTRAQVEASSKIEGAGEVAEDLTRAASRMERAAALIRNSDLAGAYEPPQVDALASLEHSKKLADELKRKVDQQKQDQAKETIKQMYVQIRAEEDQLAKDTKRLDAIKARAGDDMPRADQLALNQLPGKQGGLAERTGKIEEALLQLQSTVYVWANKDIVSTMNEVKDALGQRATGRPTQSEEARIIEQLDAMIESLATKPLEQEFEQKGGGGGNGQCKQPMPSEAELRLLKQFQLAVNRGTHAQAKADAPAKDVLAGLARRQGQLREQLGDLMSKASNGEFKLGPEPDKATKLPEETDAGIDQGDSLDKELLEGKPHGTNADAPASNVIDRMARVRQRLADSSDPGDVTQKIEQNVVRDLDTLIEAARKQQAKGSSKQNSKSNKPNNDNGGPKPGDQANNQGPPQPPNPNAKSSGAKTEAGTEGGHGEGSSQGGALTESRATWGAPTPRLRNAIVEGADDRPLEKYRALIDDYYRTLAEQNPK